MCMFVLNKGMCIHADHLISCYTIVVLLCPRLCCAVLVVQIMLIAASTPHCDVLTWTMLLRHIYQVNCGLISADTFRCQH